MKSAAGRDGWTKPTLPEIAFAGRSNSGKSSLINFIIGRKGLAKTSSTPGKTRLINFFEFNGKFIFTDLPGYGFARGDKKEIASWKPMIEEYLTERETLKGLVQIVDIRRVPDKLELMLKDWAVQSGTPHIIVATKADKLSKSKVIESARNIEKTLGSKPVITSTLDRKGKNEVWKEITHR
jgi:GTP-binding protein